MRALALCTALLAACSGDNPAPTPESSGGEAEAGDDGLVIAAIDLPALPHGVSLRRAPLHDGVELARAAGDLERPALAETATLAEVDSYVRGPLRDWMLERGRSLRDVRVALEPAEDGEDGEHVVAAAVLGVLYLRFALDLADMPLPEAVRADATARLGVRNALLRAAAPLFDGALSAFAACAQSAVRSTDPSLEAWERFCDDNGIEAQDAPRPIDDGTVEARDGASSDDGSDGGGGE